MPGLQGEVVWRGRIPAAEMKLLLRGGTVERTWAGRRHSSGSICLVNPHTGEGAWTGLGRTVCLHPLCLSSMVISSCTVACHTPFPADTSRYVYVLLPSLRSMLPAVMRMAAQSVPCFSWLFHSFVQGYASGYQWCCVPLPMQVAPPSKLFRESAFYLYPQFEQRMRGLPRGLAALEVRFSPSKSGKHSYQSHSGSWQRRSTQQPSASTTDSISCREDKRGG